MSENTANDTASYRLPYDAVPHRYQLLLTPNLEAATFSGQEQIELDIAVATNEIVMNANELEITSATLFATKKASLSGAPAGDETPLTISYDTDAERVTFTAPSTLAVGSYVLSCSFTGILNDKLCGFYRSTFVDDEGAERSIATTQFESTDARRAFPCFDEPDRKAVFSVTLDAPDGLLAISNSEEISSEEIAGGRRVRFADTIKMSTYLVCFIVGPLEVTKPQDVNGVALRVVHLPGKEKLTTPSLEIAAHALTFFGEYFGIAYPSNKLDLVAIPDFAAGAMENLGCVTFREAILLADPDNVSQVELERLAEVVEHEIAHMWFGDLVTMSWWNGIWLNEAFATYMSLLCQDNYRPEWQCFVSFARGKAQALGVDGLHATRPIEFPVRHPDESSAMFDVLTYEKGASVLWMIDAFLGGTRFRDGVRKYLEKHSYANTETSDLWDAIEKEAGDVPIRNVMDSWIYQGGYPLVSANSVGGTTSEIEIAQQPFAYLTLDEAILDESAIGSDWLVPVLAAPIGKSVEPSRILLADRAVRVPTDNAALIFNAGGAGFFRLHYDATLTAQIIADLQKLSPLERYNFCSDTWAVILSGHAEPNEFFEIVRHLNDEGDPHVWSTVIGALSLTDLTAQAGDRAALSAFTKATLSPQLKRIGWTPGADEDDQTPVLRSSLISALGLIAEDEDTIKSAFALFERDHTTDFSMDADITSAVLGVVAAHGSREHFDAILARYRDPRSPMDQIRHLNCLASLRNLDFAGEVHEMCLTEVRSQNAPFLLGSMLSNRYVGPVTWEFLKSRYDDVVARFPESSLHRMLEGIVGLAELDDSGESRYFDDVQSFLLGRIEGGKRRLIAQSLERLEVNIGFSQRLRSTLGPLLLAAEASAN